MYTGIIIVEGKRDKDLLEEDLTYLTAKMQHPELGIGKILNNHDNFLGNAQQEQLIQ